MTRARNLGGKRRRGKRAPQSLDSEPDYSLSTQSPQSKSQGHPEDQEEEDEAGAVEKKEHKDEEHKKEYKEKRVEDTRDGKRAFQSQGNIPEKR